jgi:hypothetical protein
MLFDFTFKLCTIYIIIILILIFDVLTVCNSNLIHINPITNKEYSNDLNVLYHYHTKTSKVWDDKLYLKLSNDCYNTTGIIILNIIY